MGLRDIPVLAEETAHVATGGAHTEDARAWQEMVERLLFDWVDLQGSGRGVTEAVERSVLVDTDETETRLAVANVAVARTEIAVHAIVWLGLPPERFMEDRRGLQNLEGRHGSQTSPAIIRAGMKEANRRLGAIGSRISGTADSGPLVLGAAADGCPVGEGFQVVAIFPGELNEFVGIEISSILAKEGFKAPLNVGTFPRLQTISARGEPIEF